MPDSTLEKLPDMQVILAQRAGRESDITWWDTFNVATSREYIFEWFKWRIDSREVAESTPSAKLLNSTFQTYGQIAGRDMPWFGEAMRMVVDSDPDTQMPVLALYFGAKMETLASIETFQRKYLEGNAFKTDPMVDMWIRQKIAAAGRHNPPTPFLFESVANAYEHTFSFLMKMIGQYCHEHGEMPGPEGFDSLTRQLVTKLIQETQLSRRENAVVEEHFQATDFFFSFTKTDSGIRLDFRDLTEQERAEILRRIDNGSRHEQAMQPLKSISAHHYGCPAAFTPYKGVSPVRFIFNEVIGSFRNAIWPPDHMDLKPLIPAEKRIRAGLVFRP